MKYKRGAEKKLRWLSMPISWPIRFLLVHDWTHKVIRLMRSLSVKRNTWDHTVKPKYKVAQNTKSGLKNLVNGGV